MKFQKIQLFMWILFSAFMYSVYADYASDLRNFTGAHSRMVWCRDSTNNKPFDDPTMFGASYVLMGFDTDDGKGERMILSQPASYCRPLLTSDGKRIVYSQVLDGNPGILDCKRSDVFVVNWDGSGKNHLIQGFAVDVWNDPVTGIEWIYLFKRYVFFTTYSSLKADSLIWRVQLDNPTKAETLWTKTGTTLDYFKLSADGKKFATVFPYPNYGLGDFASRTWKDFGFANDGCQVNISPDAKYYSCHYPNYGNDLLAHENLIMYDSSGALVGRVSVRGACDSTTHWPRWSNRVDFITLCGPYLNGESDGSGPQVEIFIGKINRTFDTFLQWLRMTKNGKGDYMPYLWIDYLGLSKTQLSFPSTGNISGQDIQVTALDGRDLDLLQVSENADWLNVTVSGSGTTKTLTHTVDLLKWAVAPGPATVTVNAAGFLSKRYTVEVGPGIRLTTKQKGLSEERVSLRLSPDKGIYFFLPSEIAGQQQLSIYDINGRNQWRHETGANSGQPVFWRAKSSNGIYLLTFKSKSNGIAQKIALPK